VRAPRRHEPFIEKWFGLDGKRTLRLADFQLFIVELHMVFDELEFAMLDDDNDGAISGLDLARSLVAPAAVTVIDRLLDRVRAWTPAPSTLCSAAWSKPCKMRHAQRGACTVRRHVVCTQQWVRRSAVLLPPLSSIFDSC
jgi:hypothetical protein